MLTSTVLTGYVALKSTQKDKNETLNIFKKDYCEYLSYINVKITAAKNNTRRRGEE